MVSDHGNNVISICGNHVETTKVMLCPCGNHVVSTWKLQGIHLETTWCPHLKPCSVHLETIWYPCGTTEITWKQQGNHKIPGYFKPQSRPVMETTWFPHEIDIISTHGNDMEITLFLSCGVSSWKGHHFHQ